MQAFSQNAIRVTIPSAGAPWPMRVPWGGKPFDCETHPLPLPALGRQRVCRDELDGVTGLR